MAEILELAKGWIALEVKGRGVIVQAEMGLIFIEDATIKDGAVVALEPPVPPEIPSLPRTKKEFSSVASVNVKQFLDEMTRRNLTPLGEFGALGATITKLREVLKHSDPDGEVATALGNLLVYGDHDRFGIVAAIVAMDAKTLDEFNEVLNSPEADVVQEFVDRRMMAA